MKDIRQLSDLTPDSANANRGTERGSVQLDESLTRYGAGRSILVDREGRCIAGNKTLQEAADKGFGVRVVQTDGKELVVVQRTDLDLAEGGAARELAYADNRTSETGLSWDLTQIAADLDAGVDLTPFWREDELLQVMGSPPQTPDDVYKGMPGFENEAVGYREILVHFKTQEDVDAFAQAISQVINEKQKALWYPEQPRQSFGVVAEHES